MFVIILLSLQLPIGSEERRSHLYLLSSWTLGLGPFNFSYFISQIILNYNNILYPKSIDDYFCYLLKQMGVYFFSPSLSLYYTLPFRKLLNVAFTGNGTNKSHWSRAIAIQNKVIIDITRIFTKKTWLQNRVGTRGNVSTGTPYTLSAGHRDK